MSEANGKLPEGWVEVTGGHVFKFIRGVSYKKSEASMDPFAGSVAVLRAGNLQVGRILLDDLVFAPDSCVRPEQHIRRGDLVIAMSSGSASVVGKVAFVDAEMPGVAFGAFCGVLRPYSQETAAWLRHFFQTRSYREAIEALSAGININNLRADHLLELAVPIPPLPEQRRIVARIEELQARTRRARGALDGVPALLEKFRQSVLASAFRGELTADWRELHPQEPITQTLKGVPEPSQPRGGKQATDTVIPGVGGISVNNPGTPLPPGWAWVPLLRIARQETGHTPSRREPGYWGGEIPWIGITDAAAHHGGFIYDTQQGVTQPGLDNSSARLLKKGTVCLSRTASVGYVVIMGTDMATSQDFATWTCTDVLDPEYLMYALLSEGDHIRRFGKGSTHTTIYFPEIRALNVALAPIEEQKEIVRRIREAFSAIGPQSAISEDQQEQLAALDRAILTKAFRGELVPQDPNDEPASVLLERIREERSQESRQGRSRRG